VLDANTQVLLAPVDGFPEPASGIWLINAATHDVAQITIPSATLDTSWVQVESRLYIENTELCGSDAAVERRWRVSVATGMAVTFPAEECPSAWQVPCGQYLAIVDSTNQIPSVRLLDLRSEESWELVDPLSGHYPDRANPMCSADGDLVGVLRWREPEYGWPLFWNEIPATSLTVYTTDGSVYRSFDGVFAVEWAPDASHRLIHYAGGGYGAWDPCILDVDDGSDICLPDISQWRESQGVQTGAFRWTPDGESVSFSYSSGRSNRTGLCTYAIPTRTIACPVTELELPNDFFVWSHAWSPHGDYVAFTIDTMEPGDFLLDPHTVTAAADGTNLHVWDFYSRHLQWRPDP
jgi:WD40 repeat protein